MMLALRCPTYKTILHVSMLSNDDDDDDDDSPADTSLLLLERAVADVELIQAAYPDEVEIIDPPTAAAAGSIIIQFHLSDTAHVCVEFPSGYPTKSALQIVSYRSQDKNKHRIERVVTVLRNVAQECWENECEGGLSCCAAALEAWNDIEENEQTAAAAAVEEQQHPQVVESSYTTFQWIWNFHYGSKINISSTCMSSSYRSRYSTSVGSIDGGKWKNTKGISQYGTLLFIVHPILSTLYIMQSSMSFFFSEFILFLNTVCLETDRNIIQWYDCIET